MVSPLGFVLRILTTDVSQEPRFLGTGVLIAPDKVLTCRHVVEERDPSGHGTNRPLQELEVVDTEQASVVVEDVRLASQWDLALLRLSTAPLAVTAPPLLWGITLALEKRLRNTALTAFGYPEIDADALWRHPVDGQLLQLSAREDSAILTQVQLSGGIPKGCSGGAVLLPLGDRWAYVGTLYLGGEHAATSRLIMADPVAAFLEQQGIGGLARIDAARALTLSGSHSPWVQALIERPASAQELPNPYRGLAAFREADAPYFLGRVNESERLAQRLVEHPWVTLIGPSGSGKSSLVYAGVIPLLRRQATAWQIAAFRPRSDPLGELATALTPLLYPDEDKLERRKRRNTLAQDLANQALSLTDTVAVWTEEQPETRLLLVADQFEELYTQNPSEEQRQLFLNQLLALSDTALPCAVLLTLRADFLSPLLLDEHLGEVFKASPKAFLGPMDEAGLRAAIEGPAQQLGIRLEAGLTERILKDLGEAPGRLPLMAFALSELWQRQDNGQLTHAAYDSIGGVNKALAHYADGVLEKPSFAGKEAKVRRIFVQLVRPGEGTEDTRQVATREQIGEANWLLVKDLADERLVVTSGKSSDQPGEQTVETVEVIHEALIRHWQPLQEWMRQDRQFRLWQNRLRLAMQEWEEKNKDEGALLRGARLAEAEEQLEAHAGELSAAEQAYIEASIDQRTQETLVLRRGQRRLVGGLAAGLILFLSLFLWASIERRHAIDAQTQAEEQQQKAINAKREAERQSKETEQQRELALARQLAAQAALALTNKPTDLVKGALLATESLRRAQTVEGHRAWTSAMELLPRSVLRLVHEGDVEDFAFSPDGKRVVALENQGRSAALGEAQIWDIASQESLASVSHQGGVTALAFSPNGKLLATASWDRTVVLVDTTDGREISRLRHQAPVWSLAFSPDGQWLATGERNGAVRIRSTADGKELLRMQHDGGVMALVFDSKGQTLATASDDNTTRIWNPTTGQELRRLTSVSTVQHLTFSPDGQRLATANMGDPKVRIWDIAIGKVKTEFTTGGGVDNFAFSPDWDRLLTASWDGHGGTAQLWDVDTGQELARLGDERGVTEVAFGPDGSRLAMVTRSDEVILWDAVTAQKLFQLRHSDILDLAFSPDGKRLATSGEDALRLWDTTTGKQLARLPGRGHHDIVTFSPDGSQLATARFHGENQGGLLYKFRQSWGEAVVWDTRTGEALARFGSHPRQMTDVQFSLDGKLVATSSWDGTARLWDPTTWTEQSRLQLEGPVFSLGFSPEASRLITASASKKERRSADQATIWDLTDAQQVAHLADPGGIEKLALSSDEQRVATASADGTVRIWDTETGSELHHLELDQAAGTFALTADGAQLVMSDPDDAFVLQIRDVASGKVVSRLRHGEKVGGFELSPNGAYMATRISKGTVIQLWDITSGKAIAQLPHLASVREFRFNLDSTLIATSSQKEVRVWEVSSG